MLHLVTAYRGCEVAVSFRKGYRENAKMHLHVLRKCAREEGVGAAVEGDKVPAGHWVRPRKDQYLSSQERFLLWLVSVYHSPPSCWAILTGLSTCTRNIISILWFWIDSRYGLVFKLAGSLCADYFLLYLGTLVHVDWSHVFHQNRKSDRVFRNARLTAANTVYWMHMFSYTCFWRRGTRAFFWGAFHIVLATIYSQQWFMTILLHLDQLQSFLLALCFSCLVFPR